MSAGVEWALHCCVVLTASSEPVPAARLAALHELSGSYLAKQLQALSRAGLIHAVQGKSGGYALTRDPASITVLDVVEAVEGPGPAFVCTEIRQRGPVAAPPAACTTPCAIARTMAAAEAAWRQALVAVTVADLAAQVDAEHGPRVLAGIRGWLSGEGTP
ncbi:RrF2 family transcriptional regulator [Kitasatospora sp. LaBMicrA B282]|uniref:RrF2 family transcriptional regulator n=1 Tax=Kitasatospora sp. LaBMicrA B282 TaxID=3420949 RepID=UPI003D0D8B94